MRRVGVWYDRDGNAIETMDEHGKLIIERMKHVNDLLSDPDYKTVSRTVVSDYEVSTVWLGLDHNFGDGPPILFETMIFAKGTNGDVSYDEWCWRYHTLEEAEAAHESIVKALQEGREPEWGGQ